MPWNQSSGYSSKNADTQLSALTYQRKIGHVLVPYWISCSHPITTVRFYTWTLTNNWPKKCTNNPHLYPPLNLIFNPIKHNQCTTFYTQARLHVTNNWLRHLKNVSFYILIQIERHTHIYIYLWSPRTVVYHIYGPYNPFFNRTEQM